MITSAPKGLPFLGNLIEFSQSPLPFITKIAPLGDTVKFRLGPYQAYLLLRPSDIHEVLVPQANKFYKDILSKKSGGKFIGNGLVINDGESHRIQRKRLQPAFYHKRIQEYASFVTEVTDRMIDGWQDGQPIMIDNAITELTLQIVTKTLLGTQVPSEMELLHRTMADFHSVISKELRSLVLALMPDWVPLAHKRQLRRTLNTLDSVIWRVINERQEAGEDAGDLLSTLLLAADEDGSMTMQQLRDEVMTLFLAGHETTANALSWTWYLLHHHPEVEQRMYEEIVSAIGNRRPEFQDLPNLKYTEMVFKETLRLYPPLWLTSRQAIEDVVIGDCEIKRNDMVFLCAYMTQRNPEYFADPNEFRPERFADGKEKQLPPGAYFPFGGGSRICIGNEFAKMEAMLMLASIISRVHVPLLSNDVVEMFGSASLRPAGHMQAKVEFRSPEVMKLVATP